jgi:cation:H+ antiporter
VPFQDAPLWLNLALFAAAAAFVWIAGSRLARYADAIAERTGLSRAFLGMALLGVATSLPEVATTVSGAIIGNARLVSGNLFGGVALQIAVLAVTDAVAVRGALTYFAPGPVLLFQGTMLLLMLSVALAGVALGEPISLLGIGLTPLLLVAGYVITLRATHSDEYLPQWQPVARTGEDQNAAEPQPPGGGEAAHGRLSWRVALSAAVILAAGWVLAVTGDALAEQTGLGASFVGVALVAASTSLPELSTSVGAVRQGRHGMAVSNILGTNCLEVALFFLADVFYRQGPILAEPDESALFAGTVAMVVTSIFLLGLLERRNQTVFGMGIDSLAVLIAYTCGLVGLYTLR